MLIAQGHSKESNDSDEETVSLEESESDPNHENVQATQSYDHTSQAAPTSSNQIEHKKCQLCDEEHDRKYNPRNGQNSNSSRDNQSRHAHIGNHHEQGDDHAPSSARKQPKAVSKIRSSKQKHVSEKKGDQEESNPEDNRARWVAFMKEKPSEAYDRLVSEIDSYVRLSQGWKAQSQEWEARVGKLSEEMLAGRDRFQPATDGDLKAKMNKLREDVKVLAKELRPKKISEKTFQDTVARQQLALREAETIFSNKNFRIPLLQSAIWNVLRTHMFNTPFLVFGTDGAQAESAWRCLFGEPAIENGDEKDGESKACRPEVPVREEFSEKWKSMTATRLKDKAEESRKSGTISTGKAAKKAVQTMLYAISLDTNQPSDDPSWIADLKNVIQTATELAMAMAQQRSRLELFVPDLQKIAASSDHCSDGKIIDFDEGVEGPLVGSPVLIVTPGLRKWGDGLGGNLNRSTDLEAAQVKFPTLPFAYLK
ncbi:hypothetical protein BGZ60DRAFT_550399 [Tricladium varicosporioides]|nr:hypothetical protein BGZ60DRAFT_550399 [Hymenoscyphus varicosporioides]